MLTGVVRAHWGPMQEYSYPPLTHPLKITNCIISTNQPNKDTNTTQINTPMKESTLNKMSSILGVILKWGPKQAKEG